MDKSKVLYLFKRSCYLFPKNFRVFVYGKRLVVEFRGKRVSNISSFLVEEGEGGTNYMIGLGISANGAFILKEYEAILNYFNNKKSVEFLQLEYATGGDLPLCTFFRPIDFAKDTVLMQDISKRLVNLVNIFKRPLIHLKESDIVMPVDAVMSVNHNTIRHLSTHVENWESINSHGEVVPCKLLTRVYDDDYGIYENLVFRDLIDSILMFLKRRVRHLTEILETFKESIRLDTVNRVNHQRYYLAIGKLYVGFYNTESFALISRELEKSRQIYKQISTYRVRAVYSKNSNIKPIKTNVKQTNILMMHKDYRHVYSLCKSLKKGTEELQEKADEQAQLKSQRAYELFCQSLIVFSASNFNLNCVSKGSIYNLGKIRAYFRFKDWQFCTFVKKTSVLSINTIAMNVKNKTEEVKYLIIPLAYYVSGNRKKQYELIVNNLINAGEEFDKYVFFEPFDYTENSLNGYWHRYKNANYAVLPISINEINSFRRIQKLLLEMLINTDKAHRICPFCSEELNKNDREFLCLKCRTAIVERVCKHCNRQYFGSYIALKRGKADEDVELDEFFKQEKEYLFRNSVDMNEGAFVCPHCGKEGL